MDTLKDWFNPLMAVATVIYTWIATRDKDNSQHIKAVEEALTRRLAEHQSELSRHQLQIEHVQTVQAHMPTHRDFSDLQAQMARLATKQEGFVVEMKATRDAVDSLRDYLMNQGRD